MLDGRVAIITGAGRGIGRATALLMAAQGAKVLVNDYGVTREGDNPDASPAESVVDEIRQLGGQAAADTNSVATWAGAHSVVESCVREFGRVDILVNNAGIYIAKLFGDVTEAEFDRTVAVHLKGAFACARAAVPYMVRQRYGRVVNITSRAGLMGTPGHSHYGAAKAGIMGLTLVMYRELAQFGITVNAIQPGAVTRMSQPPDNVQTLMKSWGFSLAGESGSSGPKDIAPVIAYLSSQAAGSISGQIIAVSGSVMTLMQPPTPAESRDNGADWTPDSVAKALTEMLPPANERIANSMKRG